MRAGAKPMKAADTGLETQGRGSAPSRKLVRYLPSTTFTIT